MEFLKKWKIGRLRIYVTTYRLKRRPQLDDRRRNVRHRMLRKRDALYRRQEGRCACCGRRLRAGGMEVHHIRPVSERPDLLCRTDNLLLLCPECHRRLHGER
jgi:5-methylcytosine-specific restriction protein A